jgi:hypothetical protein
LAKGMLDLWRDPALYMKLSRAAHKWSFSFSFDNTARAFRAALESALNDRQKPDGEAQGGRPQELGRGSTFRTNADEGPRR